MKFKRPIQVVVAFMLMFGLVAGSQSVSASNSRTVQPDVMVVNRDLRFWDTSYIGYVSSSIHEDWHFDFSEAHDFVISVSPMDGASDFVPALTLFDSNEEQLAQGTNTLTSIQGAGSYSMQVQPQAGGGFYVLTLHDTAQEPLSASAAVTPTNINVGESALVTVGLSNVPAEGYSSAEFTCTYDASLVEASNLAAASLFGGDPAVAIHTPQAGTFIIAIAGTNGNKVTSDGTAFTFNVRGLQVGQSSVGCTVRVSTGSNVLTQISSTDSTVTIMGSLPTATATEMPTTVPSDTPVASETPTSMPPVDTATPTASLTPAASDTPTFTSTPAESPTPTFTSTPVPTSTPIPNGTLTGNVLARKPVTVSLYDATNTLVTSVTVNVDGTFNLSAPAGTYSVRATAAGFLSARGLVVLPTDGNVSLPTITLLAGDIDGNNVIDQFDALTIGMSYNTNTPAAADLNNDNTINVLDLELLARNYRATGPSAWGTSYP